MRRIAIIGALASLLAASCAAPHPAPTSSAVTVVAATDGFVPVTWQRTHADRQLIDGYWLVARYQSPDGAFGGTAQVVALPENATPDGDGLQAVITYLQQHHHNVSFGARRVTDAQGRQIGFAYFGDDTGDVPPSAKSATRPIAGIVYLGSGRHSGQVLDVFSTSEDTIPGVAAEIYQRWAGS